MELLVAYDVATDTAEGRGRLRRVAKVCEAHGQRVQQSVFECVLNDAQIEQFVHRLGRVIDVSRDSLRIYRLREPSSTHTRSLGRGLDHDQRGPLIL